MALVGDIWKPEMPEATLTSLSQWVKKRKEKKNLRHPGPPVAEGLTPGHPNTILAKGSNPEMNVSEGLNCSLKDHDWGLSPRF